MVGRTGGKEGRGDANRSSADDGEVEVGFGEVLGVEMKMCIGSGAIESGCAEV